MHWNWDDGHEPLRWILQQPQCDAGTALYIYWHASPTWFCQFKNREEVEVGHDWALADYDFIIEIESRYLKGFYTRQEIAFDPANVDAPGDDLTINHTGVAPRRDIPEVMTRQSPGTPAIREDLIDITIRVLNEKEQIKLDRNLKRGWLEIGTYRSGISPDSYPADVVDAIKRIVDDLRSGDRDTSKLKSNDPLLMLGWLWADQLCRAYNWQWLAWDYESGARIGVFSPDQRYLSFPPNLINFLLGVPLMRNTVSELFILLGRIERTQDLAEAGGCGWADINPYFKPEQ